MPRPCYLLGRMGTLMFLRVVLGSGLVVLAFACGQGSSSSEPARGAGDGTSGGAGPVATPDPGAGAPGAPASDGCHVGDAICTAKDARRACVDDGKGGSRWVDEACAAGAGCFAGACTPGKCSDECTLGGTQGGKTCAPFDVKTGKAAASDPATKLHDRARGYLAWTNKGAMLAGGIGSARYADPPVYAQVASMDGIGDSAIWTGAFLGSEALRLRATGAPDARARVKSLVDTLHSWLNVAGEPGMLVRWAKESATTFPFTIGDYDCSAERVHCGVDHQGKKYDFIGHISRDQYQGVMFGLALAYDALGSADEDARARIRGDVVTIAKELMKERSLPVDLTFDGVKIPTKGVTGRYMVVSPREMKNGAIQLRVDLSKPEDSEMYGFQEFYPDLADLVRQMPGLSWVPAIERASSAIMLASFFRVAIHATDGVAAMAKDRQDLLAFYTQHAGEWLGVAKKWQDGGSCGKSYYANNIAMMPLYNLARLEDDAARAAVVRDEVLGEAMWPAFENTKNAFFSFIYAGVTPGAAPGVVTSARAQIAQFPPAPRVFHAVDLRSDPRYASREQGCTDQVKHDTAVDVGDRVPADFMWQREPWGLYAAGDVAQTHPGVDYLVAYFMGRAHGFLPDDTDGVCLAWQ